MLFPNQMLLLLLWLFFNVFQMSHFSLLKGNKNNTISLMRVSFVCILNNYTCVCLNFSIPF